uniref:Uncharacterized protein n=1 Tax=Romanomermis culicivorax TaxID=13658 RepID=A0A915JW55_ROMCU
MDEKLTGHNFYVNASLTIKVCCDNRNILLAFESNSLAFETKQYIRKKEAEQFQETSLPCA